VYIYHKFKTRSLQRKTFPAHLKHLRTFP